MNTKETRRTFTATEIPADRSPYTWDDFITDDFRLWEVVTSEHLRIQEHGKTALVSAAIEASRFAVDEMASAWQFGDTFLDLFHDVWQEAQEWQDATGRKWEHSPEWRKAAHEVHEVMQGFGLKGYEPYGEIDKAELAAAILTCATGNAWGVATIRGCCQGDYAQVIYDETDRGIEIDEIEARFFGGGTEWEITNEAGEYEGMVYTWKWRSNEREAQIRQGVEDIVAAGPFDLMIREFDDYQYVPKYKEAYAA